MVRALYAYSWGEYGIFVDYPGRPADLLARPGDYTTLEQRVPIMKRVVQHFYEDHRGYPELYNIFLYAMRMKGIIQ